MPVAVAAVLPPVVGAAAAVALGAVFVVSAVAKLAAPSVWHAQAADLGVARSVAFAVPYVEAVLAGWLVVQWHRSAAAAVAVVVLVSFTALVSLRLVQGRRPPCACFGALSSRPISGATVARNLAFVALAVVAML